jgi:Amino acid permease
LTLRIELGARFNTTMVIIKIGAVVLVIAIGLPHVHTANWHPFMPYSFGGVVEGAAVVFFAVFGLRYPHHRCRSDPQHQLPRAVLLSLAISLVLYIAMSLVLTGVVRYDTLNSAAPVAAPSAERRELRDSFPPLESARESKTLQPSPGTSRPRSTPRASCQPSSPPPATKTRCFLEFCAVTIENPNIPEAYFRAWRSFFAWYEHKKLDEFITIEPLLCRRHYLLPRPRFEKTIVKAAPRRDPHAVRLARHRPGRRHQPGARRAWAEPCCISLQMYGAVVSKPSIAGTWDAVSEQ